MLVVVKKKDFIMRRRIDGVILSTSRLKSNVLNKFSLIWLKSWSVSSFMGNFMTNSERLHSLLINELLTLNMKLEGVS